MKARDYSLARVAPPRVVQNKRLGESGTREGVKKKRYRDVELFVTQSNLIHTHDIHNTHVRYT